MRWLRLPASEKERCGTLGVMVIIAMLACGCSRAGDKEAMLSSAWHLSDVAGKYQAGADRADIVQQLGVPTRSTVGGCDDGTLDTCEEAYWEIDGESHVLYCDFRNKALVSAQESFEQTDRYPHCTLHLDGTGRCWDNGE